MSKSPPYARPPPPPPSGLTLIGALLQYQLNFLYTSAIQEVNYKPEKASFNLFLNRWLDGNHNYDEICCKTGIVILYGSLFN